MKNRSRIALLVVTLFMLCAVSITAYQSMSSIITLVDDGQVTHYETDASNVEELLGQLEISLKENDSIEPEVETQITDNMTITIERWHPTVEYTVNGDTKKTTTDVKTVGEFITALGIQVKDDDIIEPSKDTVLYDNIAITIKTRKVETEEKIVPIDYKTQVIETDQLAYGEKKVKTQGKEGKKTITYERVYLANEMVNESIKSEVVTVEPVDEVILKGTLNSVKDAYTGEKYAYTSVYQMEATAYTSTDDGCNNITASGMPTFVGAVAVDPRVIPLGTKLYIEGYGIAIAADTGGAIKGHIVDLYFNSSNECYNYGRRHGIDVYVLKDQSVDVRAERQSY